MEPEIVYTQFQLDSIRLAEEESARIAEEAARTERIALKRTKGIYQPGDTIPFGDLRIIAHKVEMDKKKQATSPIAMNNKTNYGHKVYIDFINTSRSRIMVVPFIFFPKDESFTAFMGSRMFFKTSGTGAQLDIAPGKKLEGYYYVMNSSKDNYIRLTYGDIDEDDDEWMREYEGLEVFVEMDEAMIDTTPEEET